MHNIVLKNEFLTVEISPKGAEMQAVVDEQGFSRLWNGDAAYWTGRAPLLFPVAGGLKDGGYVYRGQSYQLAKHGFARESTFVVERADALSAVFLLTGRREGYPFDYEFRATYALAGRKIDITLEARNIGEDEMFFSVGSHEAYACPEGITGCRIEFERAEELRAQRLDGGLITRDSFPVEQQGDALVVDAAWFDTIDTMMFLGIASRAVTLSHPEHDRRTIVAFPDCENLLIWSKPGAPYLCLEPWCNAPDYTDTDRQIEHKPGMIWLRPGECRAIAHSLTFC